MIILFDVVHNASNSNSAATQNEFLQELRTVKHKKEAKKGLRTKN